jgi:hypothetical protein
MPPPTYPVDPERWRQIERLYHSARGRPSHEREAYLEVECRGDDDLRHEASSLLTRAAPLPPFLGTPAT